jgi:crotonobetainyl-CoA:carnitine CoA-transferase CaiB-like acyl-CoA transferase
MQILDVAPAQVTHLLEPADERGPSFARARDAQAFRELVAARMAQHSATDLEQRLNASGVPAARVRTLREFTREAVDSRLLQPVVLGDGEASATTPGLGWRTYANDPAA